MLKAFSKLRARVLLLIAVPFVVLLGTSIPHMFDMREDGIMNARTRVLEIARLFAVKQDRTIERIHGILSSTALLPQVGRGVASPACDRSLTAELQKESNLGTLVLALANGDVICSAVSSSQRTNLSDRDHFKAAILTHEFSVGGYVVDQDTGRPASPGP